MEEQENLARFLWRAIETMKKYLLILYILLLASAVGAAGGPNSVSITLTTSVPGYLLHGFLDSPGTTAFIESPTVDDAFNPSGAVLNYGIKTNAGLPLVVKAKITPFEEQDVASPATVPIDKVKMDGNIISPSGGKYQILSLTPSSGTIFYAYTLTVMVDQDELSSKPAGNYVSTVEIDIST